MPRTYIFSTHVLQFPGQQEETGSILDSLDSNVSIYLNVNENEVVLVIFDYWIVCSSCEFESQSGRNLSHEATLEKHCV